MKFNILKQDFLPALTAVSRSIGVRTTLPVLGNILISTQDKKIKLAATNLEIGVIKYLDAEIISEGEITVSAKTLLEITQGLGLVKLELETNGDVLTIQADKFKASINGMSASEFPVIPISGENEIDFKKEEIISCSQILFAAANDQGRPALTGILTQINTDLNFVSTDGFRLAFRQIKLIKPQNELKLIIPKRTFEEVLRIIGEDLGEDENVRLSTSQNQVIFNIGKTILSSRLIDGNFPSWEKIIPKDITTRMVVDRSALLSAIKLASVFTKLESNTITIKTQKDKVVITSEAKEIGSQENELEAQVEGDDLQITFNAKFLIDALSATNNSQLIVEFSGPLSATLIKPVGLEGLEYVIMPVRAS